MKLKIISIVGTRPEIIRLSIIFKLFDKIFNHIIVNTMQNFDNSLNEKIFDELNIRKADYFLKNENISPGKLIGNIISETYSIFEKEKPDAVLILGDTNSGLSAISAKKLHIPIFHMEAGNRSFDINLPEEINRKIIDEIADINLPYSERARNNLILEGKNSNRIFKTGSPLKEVIDYYSKEINSSNILNNLNLEKGKYILVSIHRKENLVNHSKIKNILNNLQKISEHYKKRIVLSLHPTTKNILEKYSIEIPSDFVFSKPFGFYEYSKMQINSFCVISDSGSLAEEAYLMNFKSISIRNSTERQEAIESSNFILGNLDYDSLVNSIDIIISLKNKSTCLDYEVENVSTKIARIIQSYTKVIKKEYEE
ncbi:MAG: UDP-N-acetyl glucosamine 2-epimerase [Mycoplasmoidaceae bacterium]